MAKLYLLYGFVGAGKTTYAKELASETGAIRFSPDEWIVRLYGSNPAADMFAEYDQRIRTLIWELAEVFLQSEKDVILDFGFWQRADRNTAREKAELWHAECELIYLKCSEELMRARVLQRTQNLPEDALVIDENAIEIMRTRFESLGLDEVHTIIPN